jgi:hypothetical protein
MTWVYEGAYVIYFLGQEGQYHVDISWLLKDLLHKVIHWHYMSELKM